MVHILFDTTTVTYDNFLPPQKGGGDDNGGGGGGGIEDENKFPGENLYFFKGSPYQRGYGGAGNQRRIYGRHWQRGAGIGDILRGLWRILFPVLKNIGHSVGREGVSTGERILSKISQGENLKETIKSEGKRGIDNLLEKGGMPKQFGTGRRRKKRLALLPKHQMLIGREVRKPIKKDKSFSPKPKRIRSDTFGFY